jgi:ribokinase
MGEGRVLTYFGEGEGKTTAALGHAIRALGRGMRVEIVHFMKGREEVGEYRFLKDVKGIRVHLCGPREFLVGDSFREEHEKKAAEGMAIAESVVREKRCDLLILDEVLYAVFLGGAPRLSPRPGGGDASHPDGERAGRRDPKALRGPDSHGEDQAQLRPRPEDVSRHRLLRGGVMVPVRKYDIVSIGSSTYDVFVQTEEGDTRILRIDSEERDVCYPLGAKLLIKELHFATGGGGTNTSVALSRLGLKAAFLGKVGGDDHSHLVLQELEKEGVDFIGVKEERGMTGYSVILVGTGGERTILTYKGLNDAFLPNEVPLDAWKTRWFYLSSMVGDSFSTLEAIAAYAKERGIPYAFNPSTYLAKEGLHTLRNLLDGCALLVLNREEAGLLMERGETEDLLRGLQEYARIVVITEEGEGAHAYDGERRYRIFPRPAAVVERTGAGDAFASGLLAGLIRRDLVYGLRLGVANAESVIQGIGAKEGLCRWREAAASIKKDPVRVTEEKI